KLSGTLCTQRRSRRDAYGFGHDVGFLLSENQPCGQLGEGGRVEKGVFQNCCSVMAAPPGPVDVPAALECRLLMAAPEAHAKVAFFGPLNQRVASAFVTQR